MWVLIGEVPYRHYTQPLYCLIRHGCFFLSGTWSSPAVSGERPPPCSAFTFTMIDDNHAVLFGGFQAPGPKETNDVYILDLARMVRTSNRAMVLVFAFLVHIQSVFQCWHSISQ